MQHAPVPLLQGRSAPPPPGSLPAQSSSVCTEERRKQQGRAGVGVEHGSALHICRPTSTGGQLGGRAGQVGSASTAPGSASHDGGVRAHLRVVGVMHTFKVAHPLGVLLPARVQMRLSEVQARSLRCERVQGSSAASSSRFACELPPDRRRNVSACLQGLNPPVAMRQSACAAASAAAA